MTVTRYTVADLSTGAIVGELPLREADYSTLLNGAGALRSAKLRLPLDDPDLVDAYLDATEPGQRALYIEHGDHVTWAGPIWTRGYDTDTGDLVLGGAEMWSYWRRRSIRWNATYDNDQFQIVRALLLRAQQETGGGINLLMGYGTSGVERTMRVRSFEEKNISETIEDLATQADGFDYWIQVRRIGHAYQRRLRLAYPERGRALADSGLYWTLGNNLLKLDWPEDATRMANSVVAIGSGQGADIVRASAIDPSSFDDYPLLEASVTYKSDRDQLALLRHAQAELANINTPVTLPTATVLADGFPELGTYEPGDEAAFRVPAGTDARWLGGLDLVVRIYSIDVKPADDGQPETAVVKASEIVSYEEGTGIPDLGDPQAVWEDELVFWEGDAVVHA